MRIFERLCRFTRILLLYGMKSILDNLFISSLETASNDAVLREATITHIVSLGCKLEVQQPDIIYLTFLNILDTPESNILDVTVQSNQFITCALNSGGRVLVHCVYGQSRSATVIAAYLMSTGLALKDSLHKVKERNPTTCINPGFLAQLAFMSACDPDSVAWNHVRTNGRAANSNISTSGIKRKCTDNAETEIPDGASTANQMLPSTDHGPVMQPKIICKCCKCELGSTANILHASVDVAAFVKREEDGFWKGYKTSRPKGSELPIRLPAKGVIAVLPFAWMSAQLITAVNSFTEPPTTMAADVASAGDDLNCDRTCSRKKETKGKEKGNKKDTNAADRAVDRCDFTCPVCQTVVGFWRSNHLDLLGEYNLCDLYALQESAARVKKSIFVPNV